MKYLKQFLWQQKGKSFLTLLLLLGQSVGTLLIPYLIANLVDDGILAGDMSEILRIGGWMLTVSFLAAGVSVWGGWCSADLASLFGRDMREKLFCKSQTLSMQEFGNIGVSSMVTRSTSDISLMQSTFGMVLQLVVPAPMIAVVSIAMTLSASPKLALVLIVGMVAFLIFGVIMLLLSDRLSRQIQKKMDKINQIVRESIIGIRVIRAFGNEEYEQTRANKAYSAYASVMIRLNKLFAVINPVVWLLVGACLAAIVWFGSFLTASGNMEIGQITAVGEYAIITLTYLIMAASTSALIPKMRACLDRLEEVLEINPIITDNSSPISLEATDAPVVEFDDVTFSYHGAEKAVLENLSFSCRAGETVAIIGSTGAGKSTVAELLLRLHDVDSGGVLLHGTDIRTVTQRTLRDAIGYVPQKAFLFSGTIAENLRMGNPDATDEQLWETLRVAQADEFIKNLPKGLAARVSQGGTNFSGGQKQRLAIARALVKKASVYLFDDSFSALDVKTDSSLRKALRTYEANAAKLVIAQRISTIIDADNIIVLDEGRIVGTGRHDILLENCVVYQDIVTSQMERKGV